MIYLTRTDSGVVVVDLGWFGGAGKLQEGLKALGARPEDVRAVLLTHSHRDHIADWRLVKGATFYLSAPESALFVGGAQHRGPLTRLVERMIRTDRPAPGDVRVHSFATDTTIVVGRDTVRTFLVPGHTAGSAAYLIRNRLFVGDAMTMMPVLGFGPARWVYSDDVGQSTASLEALWKRLPVDSTRLVCTAHGKCSADTEKFRRDAVGR
jgi:glyoxylase-like metal-dependent hydrolase (beta-lactamase superfamily II)